MMPWLVLLGATVYFMTPAERARVVRAARAAIGHTKELVIRLRPGHDAFGGTLRSRTRRTIVTPALVAVNFAIAIAMLFSTGALSNVETLVAWGGNFGPRTTNGEWWRLVTATFVHAGVLQLLANTAGLVQVGLIMERLFGRLALLAVYLAAGVLSNLAGLTLHPVAVGTGASGAIFGIYGLLLAWLMAGWVFRSTISIPMGVVKRLCPAVGVFLVSSAAAGDLGTIAVVGLLVGLAYGLVLAKDASDHQPPAIRVAVALGIAAVMCAAAALPLRGIADVRPVLARVAAVEDRTSTAYNAAIRRFRSGQETVAALAQLIDRTILPELGAARAHLKTLHGVPQEHVPLVARAEDYFRLRETSWRLRADALRRGNMVQLREAERTERSSLEALEQSKPTDR
jgi:membrane associated rhomboid family serine protease